MSPPDVTTNNKKIAARWEKVNDLFFAAAQILTPIAQFPIVNLIVNPIMNGCWGFWYATWAIALKYNPALKNKEGRREQYDKAQSAFNIASYLAGGVATVAAFLVFAPPLWPIIPILLSISAIATVVSNVLWVTGIAIDLYKECKHGIKDAGHRWRIGQQALTLLYSIGSIVIAALIVASLFTPVGWAVGAGAMTFAIAASVSTLAVFVAAKFCQWQAHREAQKEGHTKILETPLERANAVSSSPEKSFELDSQPKALVPGFEHECHQADRVNELTKKLKKGETKGKEEADKEGKGGEPPPRLG